MFKTLINIITAPKDAFRSIQEKPTFWFPLLLIIGVMAFTQLWVMNTIDFEYFIDQMVIETAAQQGAPESEIRQGLEVMTPGLMGGISAVSTAIILALIFTLYAAYLNLMAKLGDDRYSFRHFFSLVCWTSIPVLFTALAAILTTLLSSTGQFSQYQLNPLSLNNLLFNTTGSFAPILNSVDPMTIWGYVLVVLGYQYLTGVTAVKATLITLAPMIIIYGGWIAIILL